MVVKLFAWNPYRFHCYGVPADPRSIDLRPGEPRAAERGPERSVTSDEEREEIWIADLFPAWMVPGLALHEWVELRTGSHRLGVAAELLCYNLAWPCYHLAYLWIIHRYPLSNKLFG